jgi:hypothetical protein
MFYSRTMSLRARRVPDSMDVSRSTPSELQRSATPCSKPFRREVPQMSVYVRFPWKQERAGRVSLGSLFPLLLIAGVALTATASASRALGEPRRTCRTQFTCTRNFATKSTASMWSSRKCSDNSSKRRKKRSVSVPVAAPHPHPHPTASVLCRRAMRNCRTRPDSGGPHNDALPRRCI